MDGHGSDDDWIEYMGESAASAAAGAAAGGGARAREGHAHAGADEDGPAGSGGGAAGRTRGWCLTFYEDAELTLAEKEVKFGHLLADNPEVYMTYGREVCPDTGRHHLQAYVHFKHAKTMHAVKLFFQDTTVHCEPQRGTFEQAIAYCHKEKDFVELNAGRKPKQGTRTDVSAIATDALDPTGPHVLDLVQTGRIRNLQQMVFFERVRRASLARSIKEWEPPTVRWYWGPTGTGKTFAAMLEASDQRKRPYIHKQGMDKWWPAAEEGVDRVVWDEFRPTYGEGNMTYPQVLSLLGIGRCFVEAKGSHVPWCAKEVWITSPLKPDDCGPPGMGATDSVAQLLRRITTIKEFRTPMTTAAATATASTSSTSFSPVTRTMPN